MKIEYVDYDFLRFDNGETIETSYSQQCCETNWGDFKSLDDIAMDYNFKPPLQFRHEDYGFSFGDKRRMFFVPCYSAQNGYYSNEVDVYYNNKLVLTAEGEERDKYDLPW